MPDQEARLSVTLLAWLRTMARSWRESGFWMAYYLYEITAQNSGREEWWLLWLDKAHHGMYGFVRCDGCQPCIAGPWWLWNVFSGAYGNISHISLKNHNLWNFFDFLVGFTGKICGCLHFVKPPFTGFRNAIFWRSLPMLSIKRRHGNSIETALWLVCRNDVTRDSGLSSHYAAKHMTTRGVVYK